MRLREIRKEKGLSVMALVEVSEVPRRTIQDIEKRGDCMVSTAIKLANALGVSLDDLCKPQESQSSCGFSL
jgi:predicted transcriptional regulator